MPPKQPELTVCETCGRLRTILFLNDGSWRCTNCKRTGNERPVLVPVSDPRRKR